MLLVLITWVNIIPATAKPTSAAKTHEFLQKLGLQKIRGPVSHHRKRLAEESRHHTRSDDSHMFIIKLPANPHYYAHNIPNSVEDIHSKSKNLQVGFKSNGKPGKIYHWNLPVLEKIAKKYKYKASNRNLDFSNPESWNDVLDKPLKEKKPEKPSYYVPVKPKKSNFNKYFAGNGKPHSFYVIENSRKAHYHRLLP